MKSRFLRISDSRRTAMETERFIAASFRPRTQASRRMNGRRSTLHSIENRVTVVLNGVNIIDNKEIDGLTAIGIDPDEGKPGPIIVQGDHGAVEFRKLTLTPLT